MNTTPYPRFKVAGKPYPDAASAAEAFHKLSNTASYTGAAIVETEELRAFELGGINAAGEKYLNHLYFQKDPMMKAFKEAYALLINPSLGQAAEAKTSTLNTQPKASADYPQLVVGNVAFTDMKAAVDAFNTMPLDKPVTGAVRVQLSDSRAIDVAGITANGQRYLNTLNHADQPLLQAFQEAYKDVERLSSLGFKSSGIEPLESRKMSDVLRELSKPVTKEHRHEPSL
jgi:hypothetical protein